MRTKDSKGFLFFQLNFDVQVVEQRLLSLAEYDSCNEKEMDTFVPAEKAKKRKLDELAFLIMSFIVSVISKEDPSIYPPSRTPTTSLPTPVT